MVRDQIIQSISKITGQQEVNLDFPELMEHGDYSSNVALITAKKENKNPRELAAEIANKLQKDIKLSDVVEKIEVAGPGFINFYLKEKYLVDNLSEVGENYGKIKSKNPKKVIVEFTDPNPFKEFHIGHLYSNTVGESISRLLEANGNLIKRVNYQGDVGLHVAKSVWGMLGKFSDENTSLKELSEKNLVDRMKFLGQSYALGATAYEEDKSAKNEINILNKKIFELDPEIKEIYEKGREWSLEYFETIYRRLGTKFDDYYFESKVAKVGLEIVNQFLRKGVFEKSEGAIVFPGEQYGLHTRVFVNSMGLPTYEAKELGLAPTKYKDFAYDQSIVITGNEINDYFKVLLAAMKVVSPELGKKTIHISHGMVKLPEGKMSSRTGKIITGEWLLDEAKKAIEEKHKTKNEVAEQISVGAIKYALLKSGIGQDITFNFDESISIEGNSGPYIQYTIARTNSILSKANNKGNQEIRAKINKEELSLIRTIAKYPEIVQEAAERYSPSILCTYIYDLAQKFNTFYNLHQVVESDNESFRLKLTAATGAVLKSGLNLLGIESPERM